MDQAKTNIPHFLFLGKFVSNMWKLRLNLMGVIVHGIGIYGFFDYFQFSHGSNLTISILIQTFMMLDRLPKTLYIQMDNCPGQNKNRCVAFSIMYSCIIVLLSRMRSITAHRDNFCWRLFVYLHVCTYSMCVCPIVTLFWSSHFHIFAYNVPVYYFTLP